MSRFKEILNSGKPVLVNFYADWHDPCKLMTPILKEVAWHVCDKAFILKVDIEKNGKVAADYKIQGMPTLIIFKNGLIRWRQSGVLQTPTLVELLLKFS